MFAVCVINYSSQGIAQKQTQLLLAKTYQEQVDLSQYWLSEKYDGVRAYWDGQHLLSREGNIFHAPAWFTKTLPKHALDGELWIGRGKFSETISTVSKNIPISKEWRRIRYMIFELPNAPGSFSQRIDKIKQIVAQANSDHLVAAPQTRIANDPTLLQIRLKEITEAGGEGLMLHRADSVYHGGRSDDLLKVKSYQDGEAIVIAHLAGKGKYSKLLGALLVETSDGTRFRIGTGFSDEVRANPPEIGSKITYKHFGKTSKGKPRFASYVRIFNEF